MSCRFPHVTLNNFFPPPPTATMLGLIQRRLYSTRRPVSELTARTASTPLAVRLRRERKLGPVPETGTDANESGLSPSEQTQYNRLKALRQLRDPDQSPSEWLTELNQKRNRIRGIKTRYQDGQAVTEVIGQPVYLPNMTFTFVRNQTPPGETYNPYEATFYIPLSVNKTDIRSYLKTAYNVDTTYIRTQILHKSPAGSKMVNRRIRGLTATFRKRAVVGLVEPFYYPQQPEFMNTEEKKAQAEVLEETYDMSGSRVKSLNNTRQERQLMRMGYNQDSLSNRRSILEAVQRQRAEREKKEQQIFRKTKEWQQKRRRGETIVLDKSGAGDKSVAQSSDSSSA